MFCRSARSERSRFVQDQVPLLADFLSECDRMNAYAWLDLKDRRAGPNQGKQQVHLTLQVLPIDRGRLAFNGLSPKILQDAYARLDGRTEAISGARATGKPVDGLSPSSVAPRSSGRCLGVTRPKCVPAAPWRHAR